MKNDNIENIEIPSINPLKIFDNPKLFSVYERILRKRVTSHILKDYYKVGEPPEYIWHDGQKSFTEDEFAEEFLEVLKNLRDESLKDIPRLFRAKIFDLSEGTELMNGHVKYEARINKAEKIDLLMIKDLIDSQEVIIDLGCGRNLLGQEILSYSDNNNLSVNEVIGIDYNDWSENAKEPRLKYIKQISNTSIPVGDEKADAIIVKWALHHMNKDILDKQLQNIYRVLKPGGMLIIIEALRTDDANIIDKVRIAQQNQELWPLGIWHDESDILTKDYLSLNLEEQRLILATEDWVGHHLVNNRTWMPLPCDYLTVDDYKRLITGIGFNSLNEKYIYFGSAPIIRHGPPSVRLVFQKSMK